MWNLVLKHSRRCRWRWIGCKPQLIAKKWVFLLAAQEKLFNDNKTSMLNQWYASTEKLFNEKVVVKSPFYRYLLLTVHMKVQYLLKDCLGMDVWIKLKRWKKILEQWNILIPSIHGYLLITFSYAIKIEFLIKFFTQANYGCKSLIRTIEETLTLEAIKVHSAAPKLQRWSNWHRC